MKGFLLALILLAVPPTAPPRPDVDPNDGPNRPPPPPSSPTPCAVPTMALVVPTEAGHIEVPTDVANRIDRPIKILIDGHVVKDYLPPGEHSGGREPEGSHFWIQCLNWDGSDFNCGCDGVIIGAGRYSVNPGPGGPWMHYDGPL